MPQWPGAVAVRGQGVAGPVITYFLQLNYRTFDNVIDGIEGALPAIMEVNNLTGTVELLLAGFSEERGGPESYVIQTTDAKPVGVSDDEAAGAEYLADAYTLTRLPDIINGPVATSEMVQAAWFTGFTADDDPAKVISELEKLLEMQRRSIYGDGTHFIGGWGQLTTIRPDGIEQRILQKWSEDQVGELIQPQKIAWDSYNAQRAIAAVGGIPEGLSRLQRERMAKKARKGTLRVV